MAKFSEKTINEVGGGNETVYCQELTYGTDNYWNVTLSDSATSLPYDLTGWTFSLRLVRRGIDNIVNGRTGLELVGLKRLPRETELNLDSAVKIYDPLNGKVRILLDDTFFDAIPSVLDSDNPPVYTGYFSATLPSSGTFGTDNYIPPQNKKVLLLFIVRSDGVNA